MVWNKGIKLDREKYPKMGHFQKHTKETKRIMSEIKKVNPPQSWLGKKLPEKMKNKISLAHKGKSLSEEHKMKISTGVENSLPATAFNKNIIPWNKGTKGICKAWNKGKKASLEVIERLRKSRKGQRPWNWQGGISFAPYPLGWTKTFKELIRYRDNYKCQLCGCSETENGERLCVHHIDYNKNNLNLDNLISMCRSCHGKTQSKKEYWIEYFGGRI